MMELRQVYRGFLYLEGFIFLVGLVGEYVGVYCIILYFMYVQNNLLIREVIQLVFVIVYLEGQFWDINRYYKKILCLVLINLGNIDK